MHESVDRQPDDPGLFVLDMLLRLMRVDVDSVELQQRAGGSRIQVAEMLLAAKGLSLVARCVKCGWDRLARLPLPGVAALRNGGFLLLGSVTADKVVVLRSGATRPAILPRTDFEAQWDGRIVLIRKRHPIDAAAKRLFRTWSARLIGLSLRVVQALREVRKLGIARVPAEGAGQPDAASRSTAVIVFAERARKFGSTLAQRWPSPRQPDELAFLPAALEVVETPPSPLGRATAMSIIGVFGIALLWAMIGTVDIVAIAPGKLVPSGRTKTIQAFETGVVRAIHVHDGQTVKAGDLLIELDPTMNAAELGRLKNDLMAARFDIARLKAALGGSSDPVSAFVPPDDSQVVLIDTHRHLLASQVAEQTAKLASIDRQLKQKESERATFRATIDKLKATLAPLQQRVSIREQLFNKELGSKLTYLTELQDLVGQQQEIQVQESRLREAEAGIEFILETRAKATAEYQRALFEELAKAEQKAAGLAQDVVKAEQRTKLQRLTAPIDGMVQQLVVHTIGGVVTPAQPLMMVVPTESRVEIEAMISNRDIGFVEVGQDAAVKIDTFSFTRYGLLEGKILSISQDAITRNKPQEKSGDVAQGAEASTSEPKGQELVYAARLSINRHDMDIDGKRVNLSPGMAVTAEIRTGSRSIISYLLSPLARYKQESLRER